MLKKTYLNKLKTSLHYFASRRRDVIKISGDALHLSKLAIFAMHRGNMDEAGRRLKEAESSLKSIESRFRKLPELLNEGSFNAGMEEYVEAVLFQQFLLTGSIGEKIEKLSIPRDVFLAGLCDLPGELYRHAIKSATKHDIDTVVKCNNMAQEIIETLTEFEFTKYLRNKFDQARQATHKLEYVVYEVSLRS